MKARKKPVEIEFYPCEEEYIDKIMEWSTIERPITKRWNILLSITTLEWVYRASWKDMIIKGINWEVYPCKRDIFEKTYEILN